MKVFIIFVILVATVSLHTYGHITIEIEPNDLGQISDILQNYIVHNPSGRSLMRNIIISEIKNIVRVVFQLSGLLCTLVAANLLTVKMEPFMQNQTSEMCISSTIPIPPQTKETVLEICHDNDFGCSNNICWRSCNEQSDSNEKKKWCFTTAIPNGTSFQTCSFSRECSPCWTCVTPCAAAY